VIGDRATTDLGGCTINIASIFSSTVNQWFSQHLCFVVPESHLVGLAPSVTQIIEEHMATIEEFSAALSRGEHTVC
jgi:hypothetical protein